MTTRSGVTGCTTCDGIGRSRDWDHDAETFVLSRCGDCDGSGVIACCRRCWEPCPLTECEMHSGHCVSCAIELETGDQAAEMLRVAASR